MLLGITWFGYAITMYFLVSPALAELPESQGRITSFTPRPDRSRVFPIVSVLVILLGILRGTVFGRIQSLDALTTTYGIIWLIALFGTLALIANGARNIGPQFEGLKDAPDYLAAVQRLRAFSRIDLVLFALVFTCMILMRFL